MSRTDTASRLIPAAPAAVYRAFATPGAMERWLPPDGMTGTMFHFDFREGGAYRLRLTYTGTAHGPGKTTDDADEVTVRFTRLIPDRLIEQAVLFESDRPEFAGEMRMTWTFDPAPGGTMVTVRCTDVPPGISAEDHAAGLAASLRNLAAFVEPEAGAGE